jgi:outer membrane lipoprotein SlyB
MRAGTVKPASIRINPIIAGVAASAMILGLVGVGAVTWLSPDTRDGVQPAQAARRPAQSGDCALCGTVESIRTVEVRGEPGAAMRISGAAGSAFAESEIEKSAKKRRAYRVTVRMDDGSFRTVSLSSTPAFNVGDKVRVVEGRLVRA